MNSRLFGAVLKKDVLCLAPLLALTALLFLSDALITRLDLLPTWSLFNVPALLIVLFVAVLAIFQVDSPASFTDDWLCRPVGKTELVGAKLVLLFSVVFAPRAIGTFIADLSLGLPLSESLLEACLLQDRLLLFMLPIYLFIAVVTRTFVQGFGALIAILIGVFVIPTPFVREPGPLNPGIGEALFSSGLPWLASTPAKLACLILTALGFWLAFWRRRIDYARVLLAFTMGVTVLLFVLPMGLLPWHSTFAVQKAASTAAPEEAARISLRNPRTCFPSARRDELASDTAFVAVARMSGLTLWNDESLGDTGPYSVAFLTNIEIRGLPLEWRAKLNYVQANYAGGDARRISLRPATYITDNGGAGTLAHAWMLPQSVLAQLLQGKQTELALTYSLTLLQPREFRVPTDGVTHALPGLGFCRATIRTAGSGIDVDCLSAFSHPAQISAQLNRIPASRVFGSADFAPGWVQWPYANRVELVIGSPRLAEHESITVTAWNVAGSVDETLTLPGILGADLTTCPLPDGGTNNFPKSRWRDAAPHEAHSINVDQGVQLEVLDFGGSGSPIVLLPGLGATAHSYDELAPRLAESHRVIAITRRGAGYSSKPDFGFDTARLAQDVLAVMDEMHLPKVLLAGHSIAGEELTWLGGHHPERFSGLVYLDAAFDRSHDRVDPRKDRLRELNRKLPPEPPINPQVLLNYGAMSQYLEQQGRTRYPEGELIAFFNMDKPFLAGAPSIDSRTQQAIDAALHAPDYAAIKLPALAIYAFEDAAKPPPPWYDADDAKLLASLAEIRKLGEAMKRENMAAFKSGVAKGQVLALPNATHYLIQSNQQQVLEAIETFAASVR
jgi:non-heme chloroperoxidase